MNEEEKEKNGQEKPADGTENAENNAEPVEEKQTETQEDGLPKSQEELDKLIERRLKKEQKKWEKSQHSETAPQNEEKPADTVSPELVALRAELQEAKAQSTAAKLGFKADCIDDAVYLALRNANKENDGEPDDEDIKSALSAVLKKHPEWKNANNEKTGGSGFRVGAPQPQQSSPLKQTATKRWNRFN